MTTAAADLDQAKSYIQQNVWDLFNSAVNLHSRLGTWRTAFDVLNRGIPDQREASNWQAPTANVMSRLPPAQADQTENDIAMIVAVVTRTIERLQAVTLDAGQLAAILASYNAAWT